MAECLNELAEVLLAEYFNDVACIQQILWLECGASLFVALEVFNDLAVEFHDNQLFLFVEFLDLRDVLVLAEVV